MFTLFPCLSLALSPSPHAVCSHSQMSTDPKDPDSLEAFRKQIDALDEKIVALLNDRARVVVDIGKHKQQNNEPVYAPDREKAVMARIRSLNKGPLSNRSIEAVYRELMSGSFALERPLRIGFLGPEGTFSHEAAVRKFGHSVDYNPVADISGVFEEVVRGHADYGLVPVENSIGGGIVDTLDAFLSSSARICAEVLFTVHHNLMASCAWHDVKRIMSKAQVFSQCRNWLAATAGSREQIAHDSTAAAAKLAADPVQGVGIAAIGPRQLADMYGLTILFENIEDNPDNVTRFFVIGREAAKKTGDDKTAIMFTTAHKPGALAEVLDVFKENGINLTDIEKRPSKKVNWEYYFFIDAQGHADDAAMKKAIAEAKQHCLQLTVLGSYPRATEVL
jgi:chorismate mutase/prephenate dehydratase